jgi:hypothetical protein
MAGQIAVGSMVLIKVLKQPRSRAAVKTLLRLLMKDVSLRKQHERNNLNRGRMAERRRRAGRLWTVVPGMALPIAGAAGEQAKLLASVDVLADLAKLAPYVEVSAV